MTGNIWPSESAQHDVRFISIARDLDEDHGGLFSPPGGPVEVEVAEANGDGAQSYFLAGDNELQEHLAALEASTDSNTSSDSKDDARTASFFFLEPAYGWSQLPITQVGIRRLFATLDVFPQVYRYLQAFGRKDFPRDEGFAGFDSAVTLDNKGMWASFESCYLLKYIEKRKDATPSTNPWSVRHALIYQKSCPASELITHFFIRLPEGVKQQLSNSLMSEGTKTDSFVGSWTHFHATLFDSVDAGLRQFINYLDGEVTKAFERLILSGVEPGKLNEFDTAQSSTKDSKTLQYLSDQARRVINIIELNMKTMRHLREELDRLTLLSPPSSKPLDELRALNASLLRTHEEHAFSLKNAQAVLERSKATLEQLRDVVALRNSEISKLQTQMANQNTLAIVQLGNQSGREAHVVKTLTVLAMVFVPASFVAEFLQMGYITTVQDSPMVWAATVDLKIYAILAIPLIFVTMLIYACVERYQGDGRGDKYAKEDTSVSGWNLV